MSCAIAPRRGAASCWPGSATEFERDLPFSVWVDALDAYVASQELGLQEAWDGEAVGRAGGRVAVGGAAQAGSVSSVADERYRTHGAVRKLLELLAADRPLVLLLDDLHWSDGASIELLGALLRRGPDADVLLALAFRPTQAPARLSAAVSASVVRRIGLAQLSEAQATLLLGELDPRSAAAIYRHGGGNPFYLEQLARAGQEVTLEASANGAAADEVGVPAAVVASLADELTSLSVTERMLLEAAAVAGEPFEPDLAATIAELSDCRGAQRRSMPCSRVISCARRRYRAGSSFAIRWCGGRSTSRLWAVGGLLRTRGLRLSWLREAPQPASALTMSSNRPSRGTRRRSSCCSRRVRRLRHELLRWRFVGSGRRCDCSARLMSNGRLTCVWRSPRPSAPSASWSSVGQRCWRRSTCYRWARAERRVELTAWCAATEHWLGRHEDAHQRLMRAWEELPNRSTAAAAVLQIELAVDGLYELDFEQTAEMGQRRLGDRAGSG